jgi:soluble lytic murein transglycosylase
MAVELARSAPTPAQGLRWMKSLVNDYFSVPVDAAPKSFWEPLFPLPYRAELVKAASLTGLDPAVIAGLIRQESEFNPKAVSPAKAMGLTQVRPVTGRELARRAGMARFSPSMLFQPGVNLRLGTIMLRRSLDRWGGRWEQTLAAYNAGPSRAESWSTWAEFQEPSEFVETIPFTETREYVQSVLRNAARYRALYGDKLAAEGAALARAAAEVKVRQPVRKPVPRKRTRT